MKILIEFLWETEAPPVFSYGLAAGLKANGHDVFCIMLEQTENRAQWLETFGPSHLYFIPETIKRNRPFSSAINFLGSCFGIKEKFGKITFDLAIRTFFHPINPFLFRFIHSKCVADICHDPIPHAGMDPKAAEIYQKQIRNAEDVIVLTKAFIPVLEDQYGKKLSRIHFMRHGLMAYPRTGVPSQKTDPPESVNFLFFGRITEYKGLHILAEAYKQLCGKHSNVSLTIAGSGDFSEYENEYKTLPNVRIINRYIRDTEIEAFFTGGNTVAVLPYTDASQSGIIPIAFDFGIPVIAAKTGGLTEQLFAGNYGILFEAGNSRALADAMSVFLESPETYQTQAAKMREGRELLKWEKVTEELINSW